MNPLADELAALLNKHSADNAADTPDFILATYMLGCLKAFTEAVERRDAWGSAPVIPEEGT